MTIKSRQDAVKKYDLQPVDHWRQRVRDANALRPDQEQKLAHLQNVVYGMAMTGANLKDIIDYFGFTDPETVKKELGWVVNIAQAELRLNLKKDQIENALNSSHPVAKIWAGKVFAGQTENVVQEEGTVSSVTIKVVKNDNPEINALRTELDRLVDDAK